MIRDSKYGAVATRVCALCVVVYAHYFGFMDEEQTDFNWSPLGERWWRDAAEACTHKLSEMQLRFAVGRHDGLTATDSARRAGYTGEGERMRQAGSRADRSAAVQELLAYAYAETGVGSDGVVKTGEAKRILSRIARKGDNNARIKALESLAKIEQAERDANPAAELTAAETVREILKRKRGFDIAALMFLSEIEESGPRLNWRASDVQRVSAGHSARSAGGLAANSWSAGRGLPGRRRQDGCGRRNTNRDARG